MGEDSDVSRRDLLRSATIAGAASIAAVDVLAPATAEAQVADAVATAPSSAGYVFFRPAEAAFIEALADHMIPADGLTPGGVDLGVAVFIDRALGGAYGKGDRLYMQGPWANGTANQGYQSPLAPAELIRTGIERTNAYCETTYGKSFDLLTASQREEVLLGLDQGKIAFDRGPPAGAFWTELYQNVMQGMFADPIYGGNRDKAAWKMIGFPGVIQVNQRNIVAYRNRKFESDPLSIADVG